MPFHARLGGFIFSLFIFILFYAPVFSATPCLIRFSHRDELPVPCFPAIKPHFARPAVVVFCIVLFRVYFLFSLVHTFLFPCFLSSSTVRFLDLPVVL